MLTEHINSANCLDELGTVTLTGSLVLFHRDGA